MGELFDPSIMSRRLAQRHVPQHDDHQSLPPLSAIQHAESQITSFSSASLPSHAADEVAAHITRDIIPALCGQATSSRYFGFVTGGTLPIAEWADNVVSRMDQNVQVHLPLQTVSTTVEDKALCMVAELLRLDESAWKGRTFTTGATGSNVLGLACGREVIVGQRLGEDAQKSDVGELGLLEACRRADISQLQILTSAGHSSLSKAASVVGFGRQGVKELRLSENEPWRLDLDAVERELQRPHCASIVAVSAGEVNTGRFALRDVGEWKRLREMADKYGAWIHVDGAFGIFARVLGDGDEFKVLKERVEGIEFADSITVDGHKLLNVPYDCGMFFTRSPTTLQRVFTNPNAAYLSSGTPSSIPSPLNIGLENSRRFRALPVYAVLLSEGREGFAKLLANMTSLARRIASFVRGSEAYELLPGGSREGRGKDDEVFMIVLFRARKAELNDVLVEKINETRQMYVSGTSWKGERAVRVAVSSWKVDPVRDLDVVKGILTAVAEGRQFDISKYRQ